MRKIKILIIGPTPPPYTGMSVVTEMLLNSSLKDRLQIIHLDTVDKREISNMGRFDLINFILALKHFFQFLYLCVRNKPDMVYLPISQNFFGYMRDTLFLVPCLISNMKIIIHLHGGYFREFYEKSHALLKINIGFVLKKASAVIVLGECLRYVFKDLVPDEKIFVVSNGVDDCFDKSIFESVNDDCFRILFLSNFIREKGLFDILNIIHGIISCHKNVKFMFAGEWCSKQDEKEARELIEKNNIADNVEFIGMVDRNRKREVLNKADLFLLPTYYSLEGQPLVILEAMSTKLPVITSRKGSISETIIDRENGFLIEAGNAEQLREKVMQLISNHELCENIGVRNREIYLKKYKKEIFIDNLYAILAGIGQEVILKKEKVLIKKKPKVLVVGYLPPPQEGTAKMIEIILESSYLNKHFYMKFLHLFKRLSVSQRGRLDLANLMHNVLNVLNYTRLIIQFQPDIIYAPLAQNRFGFLRDSVLIMIAKFLRKKIYIHFHGGNFDLFYERQGYFLKKYIGFILGHIDQLILLAEKFKSQFTRFVDDERIIYLYNCCPVLSSMFEKQEDSFPKKKITRVLFIGYISKAKGALDFVKAIPLVIAKYKMPIEFILCGQPIDIERNIVFIPDPHSGYTKIRDLIAMENLSGCVKLYPEVVGEEKEMMFSQADIFVFPSYSEGCGLVVLEAMAFGLPIITTPVGALEEMIIDSQNCFFVKPGNISGIAEKILLLLTNPDLRREMGKANKRLIRENYNPEVFLNNLAGIWNSVLVK